MQPESAAKNQATPGQTTPTTPDDRSAAFRPVEGGGQMQSGEKLLVEAYAAIWIVVVIFVVSMFRRQRALERRISTLDAALAKAQGAEKGARG